MATSNGALDLITDLVDQVKDDQSTFARKANTVTSAIGVTASLVLMFLTAWLESGTNIPTWLPQAALICGLLATVYRVSKTPNGVTDSVATKLQAGLTQRIDLNHIHAPEDLPEAAPTIEPVDKALELRSQAHELMSYCAPTDHVDSSPGNHGD